MAIPGAGLAARIRDKLAARRAKSIPKATADKIVDKISSTAADLNGPSPNPQTNLLIADIALRGGSLLVTRGIERGLLGAKYAPHKAKSILKGRTIGETLLHTAVARVATRSMPGAMIVAGGLLAKTLYDRRRGHAAKREGEAALHEMAKKADKPGL